MQEMGGLGGQVELADEVKQIIANTLKIPIEQLGPDTRLEDIGAESLDVIEMVYELEEKFGIHIPLANEEARIVGDDQSVSTRPEFRTIGEVASRVKALIEAKASS